MKTQTFTTINIEDLKFGNLIDWTQQDRFTFGDEIKLVRPMVMLDVVEDVADSDENTDFRPLVEELISLQAADVLIYFDCQCNY